MFKDATSFNADLSKWDVSKVSDMRGCKFVVFVFFIACNPLFEPFSNNSAVVFEGASRFVSDLSKWDLENIGSFQPLGYSSGSFCSTKAWVFG